MNLNIESLSYLFLNFLSNHIIKIVESKEHMRVKIVSMKLIRNMYIIHNIQNKLYKKIFFFLIQYISIILLRWLGFEISKEGANNLIYLYKTITIITIGLNIVIEKSDWKKCNYNIYR